jgi:hypothetical protein
MEAEMLKLARATNDAREAVLQALATTEKRWVRLNVSVEDGRITSINLVTDHSYSLDTRGPKS